jgi:hypothetical protein
MASEEPPRTWHDAMWKFACVDLGGRLGLAKFLHDERLADSIGIADVRRQPGVGIIQLLFPQVLAVRVVEGFVNLVACVVGIPAHSAMPLQEEGPRSGEPLDASCT